MFSTVKTLFNFIGRNSADSNKNAEIDIQTKAYNSADDRHRIFIKDQRELFTQNHNELMRSDGVSAAIGVSVYMVSRLIWTNLFCDAAFAIAFLVWLNHSFSPTQNGKYQKKLEKLLDIYRWCQNSNDENITKDQNFLNILEIIAPYVEYDDIKLIKAIPPQKISLGYAKILYEQYHIPPELIIDPERAEQIKKSSKTSNKSWFSLFQTTCSKSKQIFYGKEKSNEDWHEWVAPAVKLFKFS